MYDVLMKFDLQGCLKFDSTLNYKTLDKRVKAHFIDRQNQNTVKKDETRCQRTYQESMSGWCPTTKKPLGAVAQLLDQGLPIKLQCNNT